MKWLTAGVLSAALDIDIALRCSVSAWIGSRTE